MAEAKTPQRVRRRCSISEKRRIVELTLREGASVRAIVREQGVNRNSLYQWQALYRAGKLEAQPLPRLRAGAGTSSAMFLPVTMASALEVWPGPR
ncbi:MAG: transposase [Vulcanimicrobiaceae bacterium]